MANLVLSVSAPTIDDTPNEQGLVTKIDAALASLLADRFFGVAFIAQDSPRNLGYALQVMFSYDNAGSVITHPYQGKAFAAESIADLNVAVSAFIAAHPSYFFSSVFVESIDQGRNQPRFVALLIYNTDAADGAANWFAGGTAGSTLVGYTDPAPAQNTALGVGAGTSITSGINNSCFGFNAGNAITSGQANTAIGYRALLSLNTGSQNTALGRGAGESVQSGNNNVMVGYNAGSSASVIDGVTAVGAFALAGARAIATALGYRALAGLTTGTGNTAVGYNAGQSIDVGQDNVLIGDNAGGAINLRAVFGLYL